MARLAGIVALLRLAGIALPLRPAGIAILLRPGGIALPLRLAGIALLLVPIGGVPAAWATELSVRLAGLDVTVWEPPQETPPPPPIVLFSHGFHGCATQSRFITQALAAAGYLVFAPNHRDAVCHGGGASVFDRPEQPLGKPQTWTSGTYRDRAEDLRHLLAALHDDARWQGQIDFARLGLMGHSLGGYTVLGLAGAWPDWRLPGVRAVLALSPYAQPFLARHTLSTLDAPVMYQGGTLDLGITPWLQRTGSAYDLSPPPKYLVVFRGATHFAWTDFGVVAHRQIVAYSTAFLDHYLRDAPAAPLLNHPAQGVAVLRAAPGGSE